GGNIFDLVRKDPLKKDQNGRTNILIVGTDGFSEEDKSHPGAGLTDTMMVLSFSEEDGDVFMISLPRDMEVMHECSGWLGTWYGKLNETYPCALEEPGATFESASDITRATVSEILGLDIQYFVDVNFRVLIDVVDTLGGVTVEVANDGDPRGILDRNFDWACPNGPYTCFFVRYEKDEVVHLDGVHALALARARGAAGGYGLSRSNFDREVNQQRILIAIAEKAKETNFIGNPNKVLELISSLGRNIQTTFKVSEIRTLIDLAESLSAEGDIASRAKSIPLLNDERPNYSVVDGTGQPLAGQFRFTAIQRLINQAVTGQLDWWDTPSVNGETNGAAGW
ncbi:LCP family protein, partial [Candidatus Saccharibacteria bacterium]|nr:LCP family protein [Candidatus Saccharibacteria bacterium]